MGWTYRLSWELGTKKCGQNFQKIQLLYYNFVAGFGFAEQLRFEILIAVSVDITSCSLARAVW
jgi:hypothetical protein